MSDLTTIVTTPAYKAASTIEEVAIETRYAEESSSVDIPSSIRYIAETFGEPYRVRCDRDRLKQEYVEREKALGL